MWTQDKEEIPKTKKKIQGICSVFFFSLFYSKCLASVYIESSQELILSQSASGASRELAANLKPFSKAFFPQVQNLLMTANIWLFSAMGRCCISIQSHVKWQALGIYLLRLRFLLIEIWYLDAYVKF